jgi:hypothetical protein
LKTLSVTPAGIPFRKPLALKIAKLVRHRFSKLTFQPKKQHRHVIILITKEAILANLDLGALFFRDIGAAIEAGGQSRYAAGDCCE